MVATTSKSKGVHHITSDRKTKTSVTQQQQQQATNSYGASGVTRIPKPVPRLKQQSTMNSIQKNNVVSNNLRRPGKFVYYYCLF